MAVLSSLARRYCGIAVALVLASKASAEVRIETDYYDIKGTTVLAVGEQINRKGPGRFAAYTRWRLEYEFESQLRQQRCALEDFEITLEIDYTLPQWDDYSDAPLVLQQDWDEWYDALEAHEYQHGAHGEAAYTELNRQFAQTSPQSDCDTLMKLLRKTAGQISGKYSAMDKKLDRDTRHGATDVGATNRFITWKPLPPEQQVVKHENFLKRYWWLFGTIIIALLWLRRR